MRFEDYVPAGRMANGLDFAIRAPNGTTRNLGANQVTFEQVPSGDYCLIANTSNGKKTHVRTPRGVNECWNVTQSGTQTYRVLENTPRRSRSREMMMAWIT
jgi:hypothetical protein